MPGLRKELASLLAMLLLAGCDQAPVPGHPALWRIDGPHGQHGWLFGTIHRLPRPVAWRAPAVTAALAQSDLLVVEIAALNDNTANARLFASFARGSPQPPLSAKLTPPLRPRLAALMQRYGLAPAQFANLKTWAAALMLAQATAGASDSGDVDRGVDRALLRDNAGRPVAELEGMAQQLALFDGLPELAQRALLGAVVGDADHAAGETGKLADEWRRGDIASIARETHRGIMADSTLRQVLYVQRNRDWIRVIAGELAAGRHPFVAVGAAHMAADDGLPALLAARGYKVFRVE